MKLVRFMKKMISQKNFVKKIKKLDFEKDQTFFKIFSTVENEKIIKTLETAPLTNKLREQRTDISRNSTLHRFEKAFQLLHPADVADLRCLAKFAVDPNHFTFYGYIYLKSLFASYENRNLWARKMKVFYDDVSEERKDENMRLKTDKEILQNKIKKLNTEYNVDVFSMNTRGGKAFAAEQKI